MLSCYIYSVFGHGDSCAHIPEEECPKIHEYCHCKHIDSTTILCCHIMSDIQLKESLIGCTSKASFIIVLLSVCLYLRNYAYHST